MLLYISSIFFQLPGILAKRLVSLEINCYIFSMIVVFHERNFLKVFLNFHNSYLGVNQEISPDWAIFSTFCYNVYQLSSKCTSWGPLYALPYSEINYILTQNFFFIFFYLNIFVTKIVLPKYLLFDRHQNTHMLYFKYPLCCKGI